MVSYVLDNAADLTYDRFSKEIDNMIGRDRNWTNLIFAYYVGKRVCLMTSDACSTVKGYFEQYLGRSYRRPMQEAGGIVSSTSLQSVFLLLFAIFSIWIDSPKYGHCHFFKWSLLVFKLQPWHLNCLH